MDNFTVYEKVSHELKYLSNLPCILEKVNLEGVLKNLKQIFQEIIDKEMVYAVSGKIIRIKKTERINSVLRFQKSIDQQYFDF